MLRAVLIAGCFGLGGLAFAQESPNPDEEWAGMSADPAKPAPLPPPGPALGRLPPPPPRQAVGLARAPEEPNTVSVFGAPTLGQWKRGQAIFLGFPLLGVKLALGLLDRLDFFVSFASFYGVMNEFSGGFKFGLVKGDRWTLSASVEGMYALFGTRASKEVRGARSITGHRNAGASPGILVSYQGVSPRAARLFLDARYLLTFDTEPFARVPLTGVPPTLLYGHNVLVHFGAEMPLSARTSFVFMLGLDVHGRSDDAVVMPVASLGLVTGL